MTTNGLGVGAEVAVGTDALSELISVLKQRGYRVVGPTLRDGAVVYGDLEGMGDLPAGWSDETETASYRLMRSEGGPIFGYTIGAQSWKRFFHPADVKLFEARRENGTFHILPADGPTARYALVGLRPCDLAGIVRQDKTLTGGPYVDAVYRGERDRSFLVVVNCTRAGATCFCASMGTGPGAAAGYDLALTELPARGTFLVSIGTEAGAEIVALLPWRESTKEETREAEQAVNSAAQQKRKVDTAGLREALVSNFEHPRWDDVAARCLTCANCTMVCPTCFCTTVEDGSDIDGDLAERWRRWDSCFTQAFSYIHGGSVRLSPRSRYRQWLSHKFSTWVDQFGTFGCVGCGRCLAWCPAGIDVTAEVAAIHAEGIAANAQGEKKHAN